VLTSTRSPAATTSSDLRPSSSERLSATCTCRSIAILHTQDEHDTAEWLYRLAARRQHGSARERRDHPLIRPRSTRVTPGEAALAAAPEVSVITARKVLAAFGSLRNVCEASVDELQTVPGVGIRRATAIAALIHERWNDAGSL
jgi:ERCC4-type nuclease